jgi:hypothetical protein
VVARALRHDRHEARRRDHIRPRVRDLGAARAVCSFIRRSSSAVTLFIRIRDEWNVNPSRPRIAGTSVSIVVFELGTISPTRVASTVTRSL